MSFDFENQNIIIFGGSNGVGLHLAKSLIESGAKVLIVCRSVKNVKQTKVVP